MPKGTKKRLRAIPYARGFKPPPREKCISAISHPPLPLSQLPSYLRPDEASFSSLPKPTSINDWLAQYKEQGQSYRQFLDESPWLSARKWRKVTCAFNPDGRTISERYLGGSIYLIKLGDFADSSSYNNIAPTFADLVEYVKAFYGLPVKTISNVKLDANGKRMCLTVDAATAEKCKSAYRAFELEHRYNRTTEHRQLRVHSILMALRQLIPSDALFVIALTMEDLYDEKPDLFVAGMAAGNHRVGVFSFARYDPTCSFSEEFWYDITKQKTTGKKKEVNKRLVLQRSCKLLVHELAHLLGVDHCIFYDCCMNGSGHLEEDFRQSMFLCPVDLNKLQTLCGFDVVDRYRKMMGFFEKHGLQEEKKWILKRLHEISS